jgi:hypothetical protein
MDHLRKKLTGTSIFCLNGKKFQQFRNYPQKEGDRAPQATVCNPQTTLLFFAVRMWKSCEIRREKRFGLQTTTMKSQNP